MFYQLLIFYLLSLVTGAPKFPDGRIIGGRDANIEDYPHQISLRWYGLHICGGSIIDATHILTAAHCTMECSAETLDIRAGSSMVHTGGVIIPVKTIYQNPQFNFWTVDYDVSVLELSEPLIFSATIAPIGLGESELDDGVKVEITGWGATRQFGRFPEQLQVIDVPIVSREKCQNDYDDEAITDRMICAGFQWGGRDSCQGDSGGPLIHDGKQYGIASWGNGCALAGFPGVYSNIVGLRDFIDSIIKAT